MNNESSNSKKEMNPQKKQMMIVCCVAALLLIVTMVVGLKACSDFQGGDVTTEPLASTTEATEPTQPTKPSTAPSDPLVANTLPTTEPTEPEEKEPQILEHLVELYEQNPDLAGWIRIDGTKLDYPFMYTPDEPEKYMYRNFEGFFNAGGLPFLKEACSLDPESDNLIIYGHHMRNGTRFATLMDYASKSFWEDHPTIYLSTLYEERTYEIIAAFYDRVYYSYEDVFKFYRFIDAEDEADFNNAIENYKRKSLYDTGVTAEYGDRLLTLVTCSYHHEHGRFVVVAREVKQESIDKPVMTPVDEG